MGSENVANGAAADVDVASTESNLYQGGAIDNGAEMNVEKSNAHEAKARFVDGPNAEVESGWVLASSAEGNGSGWISADGAPVTLPPAVASQPWPSSQQRTFYLVRIPRSVDEKLRNEIKLAEARVEQNIKKREAQKAALQATKSKKFELLEKLKPIREKERACWEALQDKRTELEPISAALKDYRSAQSKGQDICSSEEELNDKIAEIQFRIQHESIPLKEEKLLLREIKQLESTRTQVCANSQMQAELMENLGPKEQIQDQAKFIRQDLDSLRKEHRLARAEYDAIDKEISKLNVAIEELQQHYKKADDAQREAFTLMKELRSKENLKNDGFYQNRRDAQNARDLASQKKVKEVEVLCTKQVEDFMRIWNMDSKFRSEYLKSNERSTVRRLETLDGRALGPGEKSPVLSEDILPLKLNDTKHVAETPAAEAPKITNSSVSGVELSNGSIFKEPKQGKPSSLPVKEDENETAGSRDVKLKSKQINTSENIESETHAAEQKEKVRQEQIAKAKEAEERKRRRSEKQESRALARAKKDAERKEKEREKKAQKKSGASGTNTIPESVEEFSDEKMEADVRPEAAGSDEATTLVNSVRDRKVVATRRKLPVKDAKPVKPVLSKRSLKKKSWPAPLWAIASILVLVLLVAVLIFMKL